MGIVSGLFALLIIVLLVVAPVGIWNRLIKIHQDEKETAAKEEKVLREMAETLKKIEFILKTK